MDVEEPLLLFRAQYLQCVDHDFLRWPPAALLKQDDAQRFLSKHLFSGVGSGSGSRSRQSYLPPAGYELRVLRTLVDKLKRIVPSSDSTEAGGPLQALSARLSSLEHTPELNSATTDTSTTAERHITSQDAYVTYNCVGPSAAAGTWRPVTLLESRSLVSGSRQTGHRTWEGALHLASYLLHTQRQQQQQGQPSPGQGPGPVGVAGRAVLELGAGTGFLSIMCARYLSAASVAATDGDPAVVRALRRNLRLNGLVPVEDGGEAGDDGSDGGRTAAVTARTLLWGPDLGRQEDAHGLLEEVDDGADGSSAVRPFDVVLGADIIYEKRATEALVEALRSLLDMRPQARILLSNALRFPDVFETFRRGCEEKGLSLHVVDYQATPPPRQKSLFYSSAMPLQILEIREAYVCSHARAACP